MEIYTRIDGFILSGERNEWLRCDGIELYVRYSIRIIDNKKLNFLDLVSISIECKNKGICTKLIQHLISENKYNIYVESILNPAVQHILEKFDFKYVYIGGVLNMYHLKF